MTLTLDPVTTLPSDSTSGTLVGRVWRPELAGPSVVAIRQDGVFDIARSFPTMRDLCESPDPAAGVAGAHAEPPFSRERYLLLNHRLARRIVEAPTDWLDEVESELAPRRGRRRGGD